MAAVPAEQPVTLREVTPDRKIADLIAAWTASHDRPFVSFEYFAPRTDDGVRNLTARFGRMAKQRTTMGAYLFSLPTQSRCSWT